MWDVSDQLNPQNSPRPGRHRLDDDYDDFDEYSDYAEAPAAGAVAAGATAAATTGAGSRAAASNSAAADGADDGDIGDGAGDGRYMRVLAIVLLAIGVCLVAYGAYALSTRGDDAENTGQNDTSASAPADSGAPADSANGSDPAKDGAAGDGDGEVLPPPANEPGKPVPPAENPPAQDEANEGPQIDRKTVKVSVLNNSEVVGLADDLSKQMGEQGWGAGETGNAPEEKMGVWEKTTVYFDPRNEEEKAAAEQIAHDNGWEAAPRDDRLRDAPAGIVVVATDPAH
ncbi:LytR C-terminal domain-containing protein [Corynebacterium sp. HMSC061H03]|uniref:LytR C-terminal domain-containing protein n=1 Tax=Corynebacterium sp. HMSC061H03 TaxID=1739291 RepID=UPI001FEFA819|nr:LytR C-terminal domain-containing protein [Corynebacterium sp. HMSC061H03]